jgi:hypothetical protein
VTVKVGFLGATECNHLLPQEEANESILSPLLLKYSDLIDLLGKKLEEIEVYLFTRGI